ncbi:uncharacterized protein [Procambarus clarkii]|uniref:uncharacterized protein n=1 Tax=Procambarus clarkii TaxID=6728 RepID=UPI0037434252
MPHDTFDQLVVPQEHRLAVFRLGHGALMGGHMGHLKTSARIQAVFYWPGITGEIQRYTRSCDTCQRTTDRGRVKPGKLQPFSNADQRSSCDRGTQFTSEMMDQVRRLLTARASLTTPYHAVENGRCHRLAQGSHPVRSYELLYGRTVKGPLQVLKNLWEGDDCTPETKTTYEYVIDLRKWLENTCQLAQEQLAKGKEYQKQTYDKKAKERKFGVGGKVLLLLPTSRNKLLLQWNGPFTVVECSHSLNYVLDVDGARKKYPVNMLKRYKDLPVDGSTKPKKHVKRMTQVERGSGQTSANQGFEALSRPRAGALSDHSACSRPEQVAACDPVTEEIPHLPEGNSLDDDPPLLAV